MWGGRRAARILGPLPAGQECHGASGAPGGLVLLPPGWLPAVDRARTRRVVLGVAGFLWGSGPVPCAGVRCRGVVQAGCPAPPYSWRCVWLRPRQVMPGVPGSLWPCGVVVVVVAPPVWKHALVRGSVACRPSMVPDRPQSAWRRWRAVGVVWRRVWGGRRWTGWGTWRTLRPMFRRVHLWP